MFVSPRVNFGPNRARRSSPGSSRVTAPCCCGMGLSHCGVGTRVTPSRRDMYCHFACPGSNGGGVLLSVGRGVPRRVIPVIGKHFLKKNVDCSRTSNLLAN